MGTAKTADNAPTACIRAKSFVVGFEVLRMIRTNPRRSATRRALQDSRQHPEWVNGVMRIEDRFDLADWYQMCLHPPGQESQ